jgi:hypothetical protein
MFKNNQNLKSKECYKDVKLMYIITAAIGLLYLIIIIIY